MGNNPDDPGILYKCIYKTKFKNVQVLVFIIIIIINIVNITSISYIINQSVQIIAILLIRLFQVVLQVTSAKPPGGCTYRMSMCFLCIGF